MPDVVRVVRTARDVTVRVQRDGDQVRVIRPDPTVEIRVSRQGPPGRDGSGAQRQLHQQTAPAAQWTISHTFGLYPSVELIDTAGRGMDSDIEFPDDHTVIVTFAIPTSGYAVLT